MQKSRRCDRLNSTAAPFWKLRPRDSGFVRRAIPAPRIIAVDRLEELDFALDANRAATDPAVAFGRAWTRHEAHLKALGIGLGREPSLDHLGAGQQPVGSPAGFALRDLPIPAGFHGAVVTRRDPGVRPDG